MSLALALLIACALISPGVVNAAPEPSHEAALQRMERTTIKLVVRGCPHCRIQPTQVKNLDNLNSAWSGPRRRVRDGSVTFDLPTHRTNQLFFTVYAPFDEWAQGGVPMVIALGFKANPTGAQITPAYVERTRRVSGCWRGTRAQRVQRTLIVTRHRVPDMFTDRWVTVAAGYLTRTLPAAPFWQKRKHAQLHATEPVVCR